MNLDEKIADIFKVKDVAEKPVDTNSVLELKTIEHQLNIHLKNKQGLKFKKISIAYDRAYDANKFTSVIDEEIENKISNKKWKALPMYLKWKYVETYLIENNLNTNNDYISNIKSKLQNNTLDVQYEDKKIIKMQVDKY